MAIEQPYIDIDFDTQTSSITVGDTGNCTYEAHVEWDDDTPLCAVILTVQRAIEFLVIYFSRYGNPL